MKSYRQQQAKVDSPVSQCTRKKRRERNRARHAQYRIRTRSTISSARASTPTNRTRSPRAGNSSDSKVDHRKPG